MEVVNWPVVTGCFRISEGCYSCPSFWEHTLKDKDYSPHCHWDQLSIPKGNFKPTIYEVAFGSDLFDKNVSKEFIEKVFKTMNDCPQHIFEVGTKRADRAASFKDLLTFTPNIYFGVAVETRDYLWRIDALREINSTVRFVSMVPILGPMGEVDFTGVTFVGAAKETWGYNRPVKQEWIDNIERQCEEQGVAFSNKIVVYEEGEVA